MIEADPMAKYLFKKSPCNKLSISRQPYEWQLRIVSHEKMLEALL
jgi:hypothetical protein